MKNTIMSRMLFCAALAVLPAASAFSDPSAGIVGYWKMNGDLVDRSPTGADGTLYGDGVFINGAHGQALSFSGTNAYVNCGSHDALNFGTNTSFSIAFWARIEATGQTYDGIVGRKLTRASNRSGYLLKIEADAWGNPGFLKLDLRDTSQVGVTAVSGISVSDGVWRHYAATADRAGSAQIYINGVASGAAVSLASLGDIDSTQNFIIGAIGAVNSQWFKGALDELLVWNRALGAEEVLEVYRSFPPRPTFVTVR